MAYDISLDRVPRDIAVPKPVAPSPGGFFRRFLAALMAARQRRADLEIARYIEGSGGITDSVEREIERRFLLNASVER
jgi:hypothetical protein